MATLGTFVLQHCSAALWDGSLALACIAAAGQLALGPRLMRARAQRLTAAGATGAAAAAGAGVR